MEKLKTEYLAFDGGALDGAVILSPVLPDVVVMSAGDAHHCYQREPLPAGSPAGPVAHRFAPAADLDALCGLLSDVADVAVLEEVA